MSEPSESPSHLVKSEKLTITIWVGILMIYTTLCFATGYLSFLKADRSPGIDEYAAVSSIEDKETQKFLMEQLEKEESEHLERYGLASQSFHIVLGALLGFMSASAATLFRQKSES